MGGAGRRDLPARRGRTGGRRPTTRQDAGGHRHGARRVPYVGRPGEDPVRKPATGSSRIAPTLRSQLDSLAVVLASRRVDAFEIGHPAGPREVGLSVVATS